MKLQDKEYYEVLSSFENEFSHMRLDREDCSLWKRRLIYQNGDTNRMFLAFLHGYSLGKSSIA